MAMQVNKENGLTEPMIKGGAHLPAPVRLAARVLSYIFHPIFIPVYLVYFIVYIHPLATAAMPADQKFRTVVMAFVSFTFFPLVTVLLLKALKFIPSIELKTRQDRIIPLIACAVWYFWIWYVWHNLADTPNELRLLALASWITVSAAPFLNAVMKISLHAISLGVASCCMLIMTLESGEPLGMYLAVAVLITGLVCTARLIDSDHKSGEIYAGLILGGSVTAILHYFF